MKNQIDYSQYECPFAHLPKDCGHELHGPQGYVNEYGMPCTSVWCGCGFRGPVCYIDPEERLAGYAVRRGAVTAIPARARLVNRARAIS